MMENRLVCMKIKRCKISLFPLTFVNLLLDILMPTLFTGIRNPKSLQVGGDGGYNVGRDAAQAFALQD